MGLYIHGLLENNLYENDMEHTINKLCSLLNKRLFIMHNHIAPPLPDDIENYIVADLFYTETINDEIKKEGDIWIDIYDEDFSYDFIISKTGVLVGDFKFKWYFFNDYLKGDTWLKEYFKVHIEDIIQIGKLFNSKQLLLYPDELLEVPFEMKIMEKNHLIDNVLSTLKDYTIVSDKDIPLPVKDEIWIYRKNIETNCFTLNDWENYWANRKEPEIQYEDD